MSRQLPRNSFYVHRAYFTNWYVAGFFTRMLDSRNTRWHMTQTPVGGVQVSYGC